MAHHAARLGAALAFCDRCPCSVSLHPPQAALDSAAPKGEPLTGSRVKPPLLGEVSAAGRRKGFAPPVRHLHPAGKSPFPSDVGAACRPPVTLSCVQNLAGKNTAGSRPRPTKPRKISFFSYLGTAEPDPRRGSVLLPGCIRRVTRPCHTYSMAAPSFLAAAPGSEHSHTVAQPAVP